MIPESGNRFSEKIVLKQKDQREGATTTRSGHAQSGVAGTPCLRYFGQDAIKRMWRETPGNRWFHG
ncbi:MAG: hypothetical protein WBA48_05080 [Xanthobacteraceae bacterium]